MRRLFISFIAYTMAVLGAEDDKVCRCFVVVAATPLVFTWSKLHVRESGIRENFTRKIGNHRLWNPESH